MNWCCRKFHLNSKCVKLLPSFQSCVNECFFSLPPTQAIGLTLVGLGAWLEIEEQSIQAAINQQQLLFGPYIIIAVGCIIVLIAFIGMVGACCDNKLNRILLGLVSAPKHYTPSPLTPSHITSHPHLSISSSHSPVSYTLYNSTLLLFYWHLQPSLLEEFLGLSTVTGYV